LLRVQGHRVVFATPDGKPAQADPKIVTGEGLGIFAPFMKADANGRTAYSETTQCAEFQGPISYDGIVAADFDALLLPGGHAPGMRPYLESALLQSIVAAFFDERGPSGRFATASSWPPGLVIRKENRFYMAGKQLVSPRNRTYPITVEDEVRAALADPTDFMTGPIPFRRDSPARLNAGFTVRDANYLSGRWPGDAHRFAREFAAMLTLTT
jgi:protease I